MFCDDIFGDSPAGVRKSVKGDGLPIERSGLHDNWDDANGYYSKSLISYFVSIISVYARPSFLCFAHNRFSDVGKWLSAVSISMKIVVVMLVILKVVQYWAEKGVSGFTVFKYRLRRLEGQPDLTTNQNNLKPSMNLLAMAVGIKQKVVVNQIVQKFISSNFVVMLFHYDGIVDEWWILHGVIASCTCLGGTKQNGGLPNGSYIQT